MFALRVCLSAILVLSLLVTSQVMAQARLAEPAAGQMVLCIGSQSVTVYTDAEGQPTTPPHLCPDCALATLAVVPEPAQIHAPVRFARLQHRLTGRSALTQSGHLRPGARGPPAAV